MRNTPPFASRRRERRRANEGEYRAQHSAGYSEDLPSLADMVLTLKRNYAVLDEVDRNFLGVICTVANAGHKAKIETIIECRSMAWSMMNRYGLQ